ncbi:hypothetical protein ACUTGL_26865, partial [Klebsiella pneumoniae]|uniref:hypothetical protein n=1 Tax=Klebsiella pneumoniae TaxID=573 RepID=UPI0040462AD8
ANLHAGGTAVVMQSRCWNMDAPAGERVSEILSATPGIAVAPTMDVPGEEHYGIALSAGRPGEVMLPSDTLLASLRYRYPSGTMSIILEPEGST